MAHRLVCLLLAFSLWSLAQAPAAEPVRDEAVWTDQTLAALKELKSRVDGINGQLDEMIQALRERKVALQAKSAAPPQAPAFGSPAGNSVDRADPKKPPVRCAALTSKGDRCSRAALAGLRYCSQHQLARQK